MGLRGGWPACYLVPSGKLLHNYGKSPFLMGKSTISTGPFSIAMLNYQRVSRMNMHEPRSNGWFRRFAIPFHPFDCKMHLTSFDSNFIICEICGMGFRNVEVTIGPTKIGSLPCLHHRMRVWKVFQKFDCF